MSRVYTHALNMHYISLIFRAHAGYVVSIFGKVSSRAVASCMCIQLYIIELYSGIKHFNNMFGTCT